MILDHIAIQIIAFSFLLGLAYFLGKFSEKIGLGEVVGQILGGIIAGPHFIKLLAALCPSLSKVVSSNFFLIYNDSFEHEHFFVFIFLGIIAFSLGEELHFDRVKKLGNSTLLISFLQTAITLLLVTFGIYFVFNVSLGVSLVIGSIAVATAPAVTFILMDKFEITGKLKNILANILVIQDLMGLILFSIFIDIAEKSAKGQSYSFFSVFSGLSIKFILAFCIGLVLFFVLKYAIKLVDTEDRHVHNYSEQSLLSTVLSEHPTPSIEIFIIMLSSVSMSIALSMYFHLPFLITAITAGALISNFHSHAIFDSLRIGNLMPIFNLMFFALIGANVSIETFSFALFFPITAYVLLRSAGKISGGWLGCKIAKYDRKITAVLPRLMLPQAGLAAVETIFAASVLSGYGGEFLRNVIIPGIVVFEISGAWLSERTLVKWKSWILGEEEALHSKPADTVPATFSDLIKNRVMELMSRTKEEAVYEMSQLLLRERIVTDISHLNQQVLEREGLASTSIGEGVAVPHCRSSEVSETVVVCGILRHKILWDKHDREPVELLFLIVTPCDDPEKHIEALKTIALTAGCPNFRNEFRKILESSNIHHELKNYNF